jgi:hypothetical protein
MKLCLPQKQPLSNTKHHIVLFSVYLIRRISSRANAGVFLNRNSTQTLTLGVLHHLGNINLVLNMHDLTRQDMFYIEKNIHDGIQPFKDEDRPLIRS